LPSCEICCQ